MSEIVNFTQHRHDRMISELQGLFENLKEVTIAEASLLGFTVEKIGEDAYSVTDKATGKVRRRKVSYSKLDDFLEKERERIAQVLFLPSAQNLLALSMLFEGQGSLKPEQERALKYFKHMVLGEPISG